MGWGSARSRAPRLGRCRAPRLDRCRGRRLDRCRAPRLGRCRAPRLGRWKRRPLGRCRGRRLDRCRAPRLDRWKRRPLARCRGRRLDRWKRRPLARCNCLAAILWICQSISITYATPRVVSSPLLPCVKRPLWDSRQFEGPGVQCGIAGLLFRRYALGLLEAPQHRRPLDLPEGRHTASSIWRS